MSLTKVTQLIQYIGTARDVIATGDEKTILGKLYIFEKIYNCVRIQLDKFMKNSEHELDFTFYDLKELSDEIYEYLETYPQKFLTDNIVKRINGYKYIDNVVLKKFNQSCCDAMYIDVKLRECYKILSYAAGILYVWELNNGKNVLK